MAMKRKHLLGHGGGVDPDDLVGASAEARNVAARYAVDSILESRTERNPLDWWEALRVCAECRAEMSPDLAAYVLRVTEALLSGVGNISSTQAERHIAEALEFRPKQKGKHITCFESAKAAAVDAVHVEVQGRAPKRLAARKKTSLRQAYRAKAKFRKSPS